MGGHITSLSAFTAGGNIFAKNRGYPTVLVYTVLPLLQCMCIRQMSLADAFRHEKLPKDATDRQVQGWIKSKSGLMQQQWRRVD